MLISFCYHNYIAIEMNNQFSKSDSFGYFLVVTSSSRYTLFRLKKKQALRVDVLDKLLKHFNSNATIKQLGIS